MRILFVKFPPRFHVNAEEPFRRDLRFLPRRHRGRWGLSKHLLGPKTFRLFLRINHFQIHPPFNKNHGVTSWHSFKWFSLVDSNWSFSSPTKASASSSSSLARPQVQNLEALQMLESSKMAWQQENCQRGTSASCGTLTGWRLRALCYWDLSTPAASAATRLPSHSFQGGTRRHFPSNDKGSKWSSSNAQGKLLQISAASRGWPLHTACSMLVKKVETKLETMKSI